MSNTTKIMVAAMAGAVVGAAAALVLAPASGRETREKIMDMCMSGKRELEDLIEKGKEALKKTRDNAESMAEDTVEGVKEKAKEQL